MFGVWAPGRGRRQAHLLRPLRPAAPRAGGGRDRGQRRHRARRLQGPRPGRPGLRRADAGQPARPHRDRPLPLLHDRLVHLGERPADVPRPRGPATGIALGHNGNLVNTARARRAGRAALGDRRRHGATTDSDLITGLLAAYPDLSVEAAARRRCCRRCSGAFSLVFMDEHTLYAARDAHGVRPLVLGRLDRGWVVASETAALDIVGASFVREVEPGELIAIDERRPALGAVRPADAQGLPVRVRLPGPAGHHDRRPQRARRPGRGRPPARPRAPGRGRPGHPGARVRHPGRDRLRRGVRHPVRPGPGQELLRRPHVHPAVARRSASSASGSSSTRCGTCIAGQAARRRRRLDRARQHPAGAGPDAARGRARSRCTSGSPRRR